MLFVCQDAEQRDLFLHAADTQLSGYRWHPDAPPDQYDYVGRQRILFATEVDAHAQAMEARRVASFPREHPSRQGGARRVRIAIPDTNIPHSQAA